MSTTSGVAPVSTVEVTAALAALAAGPLPDALGERTLARVCDLVADHLGVALCAWSMPATQAVAAVVRAEHAGPAAMLYGGGRTSARNAALVNGTAAHGIELDDTHDRSLTHPGASVIPAALAVGETTGARGADVLRAIAVGYEVQCRLGLAIGQALIERGMHPTATLGVFGATAAAGRLLGLDATAMGHAFGIAGSMCAGLMQFSQDPAGTMVKRLYGGLPAERGVLAAGLAQAGVTGPRGVIEGRYGVAAMLAGVAEPGWSFASQASWAVDGMSFKRYPCCKNFHAMIEAIDDCKRRHPFAAADVAHVDAFGPRAMIEHHMERRPRSTMAAQYSLPYVAAVAIADDPATPASFLPATYERADLLALAARVDGHVDAQMQRDFPAHFAGAVRIALRDGTTLDARVRDAAGTPVHPLDREGVAHKFRTLTADALAPQAQHYVLNAVARLPQAASLEALVSALASGAAS